MNTCSFCGKREVEVGALFAGPPTFFVCDECIDLCNDIIADEGLEQEKILPRRPPHLPDVSLTCSFCGRTEVEVDKLIAGPEVYICDACVRRFTEMLAEKTL